MLARVLTHLLVVKEFIRGRPLIRRNRAEQIRGCLLFLFFFFEDVLRVFYQEIVIVGVLVTLLPQKTTFQVSLFSCINEINTHYYSHWRAAVCISRLQQQILPPFLLLLCKTAVRLLPFANPRCHSFQTFARQCFGPYQCQHGPLDFWGCRCAQQGVVGGEWTSKFSKCAAYT